LREPCPVDLGSFRDLPLEDFANPLPGAGTLPVPQARQASCPRGEAQIRREVHPGHAEADDEDDPPQARAVIEGVVGTSSGKAPPGKGQQRQDLLPKGITDKLGHLALQYATGKGALHGGFIPTEALRRAPPESAW